MGKSKRKVSKSQNRRKASHNSKTKRKASHNSKTKSKTKTRTKSRMKAKSRTRSKTKKRKTMRGGMPQREREWRSQINKKDEPFDHPHAFLPEILVSPHKENIDKILTTPYDWLCVRISDNEYKIIVRADPDNEFNIQEYEIKSVNNNTLQRKEWVLRDPNSNFIMPTPIKMPMTINAFIDYLRGSLNFLVFLKSATNYADRFSHEALDEEVGKKKQEFNKHFANDKDMFIESKGIETLEEKLKKEGDWLVMKKDKNEHILLLKCETKTRKFRFKKIDNKKITVHEQEKYRFSIIKVRIGFNKSEESYFYYKDIFDCINDIRLGVPPISVFYDKLVNECPLKDLITPGGSTLPGPSPSPTTGLQEGMDF